MSIKYVFGVDIGGTTVKTGLFTAEGNLVNKFEIETRKEDNGNRILPDIAEAIRKKLEEYKIDTKSLAGVGVGVPGPILEDRIVNQCVNLGWGIVNVEEELSSFLGKEYHAVIKAGNDANVAALGEMWKGGARGHKNIVMVTLGTGVGGGVVINSEIISGRFGAGGEIGHIQMSDTETEACGCGKKGCLEQYASATGIARAAREIMGEELSAKEVFDLAKAGNRKADEVVDFMAKKLGTALSYISCVIDPEVFVIGGGVSNAGEFLIERVKKFYQEAAFHASKDTKFVLATLGNDAGIYGAARMVL